VPSTGQGPLAGRHRVGGWAKEIICHAHHIASMHHRVVNFMAVCNVPL
jgi:hypothetical protein